MANTTAENIMLIAGDWVVDEYWFLVQQHMDLSSATQTGFMHYRIASNSNEIISDLCGAGHVARVLYHLSNIDKNNYKLYGLGIWCENDAKLLKHLIHTGGRIECDAGAAFCLTHKFCSRLPNITLNSLQVNRPTMRVVRQYHERGGRLEQINRVDWTQPSGEHDIDLVRQKLNLIQKDKVKGIVIYDLKRGAIDDILIRELKEQFPTAQWYVRSKEKNPSWLNSVGDKLELLVIGPELAELHYPWINWLTKDKLKIQILEALEGIPGKTVVILSYKLEIIARLNTSKIFVMGNSGVKPNILTEINWSSAIFASLVRSMHGKELITDDNIIRKALEWADKFSGITLPGNINGLDQEKREIKVIVSPIKLEKEEEWLHASEGCGIKSNNDGELRLEVWRGQIYPSGYIACIEKKQEILNMIGRRLRAFKHNKSPNNSLRILLQADPGSGKTFLAKALANAFGFSLIRYDVTQMLHRDDLLDVFNTVALRQENEMNPILVFIDEINAELDGSQVYGAFLAPLEEGIYVRRGMNLSLKPCVWIFAGTDMRADETKKKEKMSDFESRMDMIAKIDFKSLTSEYKGVEGERQLRDEARLEQVYLGASMIKSFFPEVHEISVEILQKFYKLDPTKSPIRKIRRLAALLHNVQYGRVTVANCDNWESEGITWHDGKITKKKEDNLVKLVKLVKLVF